MERTDFIKEKIIQIEDYDKIDEELKNEINSNPEYLHIFDEYKSLSELLRNSLPTPVKNKISLSDSVIQRVRDGDTAPKYINSTGFRFPFATAACLLIVCAVLLTARFMPEKHSRNYDAQNNMAAESYSDEEVQLEAKLVKSKTDSSLVLDTAEEEAENGVANTPHFPVQTSDDIYYSYACNDYKLASEEPESGEGLPLPQITTDKAEKLEKVLESFEFAEEAEIYKAGAPGVKNYGFKNISQIAVTNKDEAEALAKNECTIPYDTVKTFFDADNEIWKVLFMTEGTLGNCQTVYLDKSGITQLIVYGE